MYDALMQLQVLKLVLKIQVVPRTALCGVLMTSHECCAKQPTPAIMPLLTF